MYFKYFGAKLKLYKLTRRAKAMGETLRTVKRGDSEMLRTMKREEL